MNLRFWKSSSRGTGLAPIGGTAFISFMIGFLVCLGLVLLIVELKIKL